jgi:hypothetical protein
MKRLVMLAILNLCGKAILLALLAGIAVGVLGYVRQWETALAYSNAFFIAGCLAIIAGTSTRLAAGQDWRIFQLIHAESLREMSNLERTNFFVETSSSAGPVILGFVTGLLLIITSVVVMKMF